MAGLIPQSDNHWTWTRTSMARHATILFRIKDLKGANPGPNFEAWFRPPSPLKVTRIGEKCKILHNQSGFLPGKHVRNPLPGMPVPQRRNGPPLLFSRQHPPEFSSQFLRIAPHQNIRPQ